MNKLFFFIVVSLGAVSVLGSSLVPGNEKPTDFHEKITSATHSPNTNENDTSLTPESLNIIVPSGSIVNSTNPKVVTLQNSSSSQNISQSVKISTSGVTPPPKTTSPTPPTAEPGKHVTLAGKPAREHDAHALTGSTAGEIGKWIIYDDQTKLTCIIAQMAMQLNVTYPMAENRTGNATIEVPADAKAEGNCSGSPQSMVIKWGPGHSLQINFAVNDSAKDFYVSGFALTVNAVVFKNVSENCTTMNYESQNPEFLTPLDMSYKCDKSQQVNLTSPDKKFPAVLTLKNTQLEAYMNSSKTEFGAAQDCDVFETPDIVPIAVGCALAILVLVVLVAYLIGRKRSQNRGYLSM